MLAMWPRTRADFPKNALIDSDRRRVPRPGGDHQSFLLKAEAPKKNQQRGSVRKVSHYCAPERAWHQPLATCWKDNIAHRTTREAP